MVTMDHKLKVTGHRFNRLVTIPACDRQTARQTASHVSVASTALTRSVPVTITLNEVQRYCNWHAGGQIFHGISVITLERPHLAG